MSLKAKHPQHEDTLLDWHQMLHSYAGERAVKDEGTAYLPSTTSMVSDGMGSGEPGALAYDAYKTRAVFPSDVTDAVKGLIGIMHRRPARIEVPKAMEAVLKRITISGEDVQTLLRKINEAQLIEGRVGLLLDIPDGSGPDALPLVSLYPATSVLNWDTWRPSGGPEEFSMVVLDETGQVMQSDLTWQQTEAYRVLAVGGVAPLSAPGSGFVIGTVEKTDDPKMVQWRGFSRAGRTLETIPFVMCNAIDLAPEVDVPPLLSLSNLCMAIYRAEADYRHALFMQGQETLVICGDNELDPESEADETRLGAGAILRLTKDSTAEYVGVSADGLKEMRSGLDADYTKASELGMRLMDMSQGGGQQSGDALRQRIAAKTASLTTIAIASAKALESILRHAARLMGEDEDKVVVEPNLDFANEQMTGRELLDWTSAKKMGAPISNRTIHEIMKTRELTRLTYEEELEEIDGEEPLVPIAPPAAPGAPGAPGRTPPGAPGVTPPPAKTAPKK